MVEELMSESLNYSRYVGETALDPARDTHRQLAIHSESQKKGGDGSPNSSSCAKAANKHSETPRGGSGTTKPAIYSESRKKRGDGTLNSSSCTKAVNKLTGVVVHTEGPDLSGKHMTCRSLY